MVNHSSSSVSQRALECKEKGNAHFQSGDYKAAERSYTEAIQYDPFNPILFTNRAMVFLKLSLYDRVIDDATYAIKLLPQNMKAYFQLAQAQLAKKCYAEALTSALMARTYCLEELYQGKKGGNSIGPITDLVLKCKKKNWEMLEKDREMKRCKLFQELQYALEERRDREIMKVRDASKENSEKVQEVETEYERLFEEFRRTWGMTTGEKKREVPDWLVDDITFSIMLDPVVTKNGQSYDRASILQHLQRSQTDPLTREPLYPHDLRPNLALREASEEFLKENGWAVDW